MSQPTVGRSHLVPTALVQTRAWFVTYANDLNWSQRSDRSLVTTRLRECADALQAWIEYERDRRKHGVPDWTPEQWATYHQQERILHSIDYLVRRAIIDLVTRERNPLKLKQLHAYMVTGVLKR